MSGSVGLFLIAHAEVTGPRFERLAVKFICALAPALAMRGPSFSNGSIRMTDAPILLAQDAGKIVRAAQIPNGSTVEIIAGDAVIFPHNHVGLGIDSHSTSTFRIKEKKPSASVG